MFTVLQLSINLLPFGLIGLLVALAARNELLIKLGSIIFAISILGLMYSVIAFIISTLFIKY
jgi:hypothetical protein